jgi:alpha-acetolactate decarboxylase
MTIEQLSYDIYYKMEDYHQITIDIIQEAEDILEEDSVEALEKLGALSYRISVLLGVFNPEYKVEIESLGYLEKIIDDKIKEIERI